MAMGTGFLKIQLYVGDYALHGDSVTVLIKKDGATLHTLQTDENGTTGVISLDCPCLKESDGLDLGEEFYTTVDVEIPRAQGYKGVIISGVQIFDGITSDLDIHLDPVAPGDPAEDIVIHIPREHGVDMDRDNGTPDNYDPMDGPDEKDTQTIPFMRLDPPSVDKMGADPLSTDPDKYAQDALETFDDDPAALVAPVNIPLANEVVIPDFITVHLGTPNAAARNVRVPFKEYIKNV